MCVRARRFFARLNRLEFSTPLVEASSGNPEFLGKIIDAFTGLHPLYGGALKLPGISLPSLHWCFLSRRVCPPRLCQFKGSFHPGTLLSVMGMSIGLACEGGAMVQGVPRCSTKV